MKKLLICLTFMTTIMTTTIFANTFEQSKDDLYNTYNEAIEKTIISEKLSVNMNIESVYKNVSTTENKIYFCYMNSTYDKSGFAGKVVVSDSEYDDYYQSYNQFYLKNNKLYQLSKYYNEDPVYLTDAEIKDEFKTFFPQFKKEDIISSSYKKQGDNYLITFELKSVQAPHDIYIGPETPDLFNYKNSLNILVDKDLNIIKYDFTFVTCADEDALTAYTLGEKLLFGEENVDTKIFKKVYSGLDLTTTGNVYFNTKNDFKLVFPEYLDEISANN